ncbi:Gid11p [Lachancea thermotolerans CBS 6340]|uniref:KLTH0G11308p n=1 Tax=Lachancea thermotolerans (strain ATCC 56472 / CBS 6340 / NRRL Y-8284) TaxID=559295 RepID=C5DMS7_LACTC|nr:KLTH0G11308p [Lachancea thermotolerans CBS 6340]CAR25088.1 KLTH0G11308p [Lachancea thermotolerans CBS 6340]
MTISEDSGSLDFEDDGSRGSDKVFQNYLMPTLKLYDTRVSINHWQLRDCVKHSSTEPGKIYYIYEHSIRVLDTRPHRQEPGSRVRTKPFGERKRRNSSPKWPVNSQLHSPSQEVVHLDFKSRCFQENSGILVSGGLIGPDDAGNWGHYARHPPSRSGSESNTLNTSNRVSPMRMTSSTVLSDHSSYSNPDSWKGVVSIYNEENDACVTYRLGQYINNCVSINRRNSQQYDLFACNNDAHLYQCDISNRGVELTRRYSDLKFPLNNATLSHDGKSLITSGDSCKFAIYRQSQVTGFYSLKYDFQPEWGSSFIRSERIPRYAMPDRSGFVDHIYEVPGGDHGFYTSFSENDMMFATVFQNGTCCVYDTRKLETPLAELSSTRKHTQNGAFRVCKFSKGLDDLLFISEHHGRVHVIDTRNFMNHQVIMIPDRNDSSTEQKITAPAGRRSSLPVELNDPHVTFATSIPVNELQPKLLPYPKLVNCMDNSIENDQTENKPTEETPALRRERRRSEFRVRRYSTSNNHPTSSLESIDPSILDTRYSEQNYRAVDNYNYVGASSRGGEYSYERLLQSREDTESGILFDNEIDFAEAYSDGSDSTTQAVVQRSQQRIPNQFGPRVTQYTGGTDRTRIGSNPAVSSVEENSISGIDWMDDEEGSSLIIGTDYGIMKWNINSWARRSFPSYDFC